MRAFAIAVAAFLPSFQDAPPAPDFTLKDVEGKTHALASLKGRKAVVLVFTGIECPRGVAAEPRLSEMAKTYAERGVAFLAVNSNRNESVGAVADHVKKGGFALPVLRDEKGAVADLYKVDVQPAAFLLDSGLRVRYRGLIDDHKIEEFVRRPYLKEALDALLDGKEVAVKETEPEG
jgi:peroxiredoxin